MVLALCIYVCCILFDLNVRAAASQNDFHVDFNIQSTIIYVECFYPIYIGFLFFSLSRSPQEMDQKKKKLKWIGDKLSTHGFPIKERILNVYDLNQHWTVVLTFPPMTKKDIVE